MIHIPTIGIMVNTGKNKAIELGNRFLEFLQDKSVPYLVEPGSAGCYKGVNRAGSLEEVKEKVDYLFIFGGDGTLLRAAGKFCGTDIPLLGINVGSLGFMTVIEADFLYEAAEELLAGNFTITSRMMIASSVYRDGEKIYCSHGLNDAVISRGDNQNLLRLNFYIDEEFIAEYQGDGMIAATPTGSTAYSLSAGGPIINPGLEVMLLTPICPHNLYIRPMVIRSDEQVRIKPRTKSGGMRISTDGRSTCSLSNNDEIIVERSDNEVKMIHFPDRNFYRILRDKMKLGKF